MSATGTYEAVYVVDTFGPHLSKPISWTSGDKKVALTLMQEQGVNLRLQVKFVGVLESDGKKAAERIAAEFWDQLILSLTKYVVTAGPVRLYSRSFTDATGSKTGMGTIHATADAAIALSLDATETETALEASAKAVTTSAAAAAARSMLRAAISVHDPVTRYLMLYSTLMFVAEITGQKKNQNKPANQGDVDALLLAEESKLPQHPNPRDPKKMETALTQHRNEFIHAEGRGQNAPQAVADMKRLVATLQTLSARIVRAVP